MNLLPDSRHAALTGGALALMAATSVTTALLLPHAATAATDASCDHHHPSHQASHHANGQAHGRLRWHVAAPQLRGPGHVGTNLRVTHVRPHGFVPAATSFTYQWLRGGQPIPGATEQVYTLTGADHVKKISARVVGHRDGYRPGSAVSNTVVVAR